MQQDGSAILLMLDANDILSDSGPLREFIVSCGLFDLHSRSPAPSTYIGSATRRIDFMFGCEQVLRSLSQSGTLSYTDEPQSNHRGLFVDLQMNQIFDSSLQSPIQPMLYRTLQVGNPELISRYHSKMMTYYESHNMVQRIQNLYDSYKQMSRANIREILTKWDNDQGRAMTLAEDSMKKPARKYQWSPKLRNAAIVWRYWKLRLREITRSANYHPTILSWQHKVQQNDPLFRLPFLDEPLSIETVREHLNVAQRELRTTQKRSKSLRLQTYQELLETYEDDNDPATRKESRRKAKVVSRTIASETCRAVFRNIENVLKPREGIGSVSRVNIPQRVSDSQHSTPGSRVYDIANSTIQDDLLRHTVITKHDIEQHLLQYNRDAFRAAARSPCGHGTIYESKTFSSLSPTASQLLRGSLPADWPKDDPDLTEFLASFCIPQSVLEDGPIPSKISEEDITRGFKHWSETTTTSPSGRHLGHYKALVQHPTLLRCFSQFMNIAISSGIAISRWCKATTVLIEKDPGVPNINRLRIIHLFEADYNFFLKLQWGSRLVRRACDLNLLHDGQYGSTPRRTSMDPVMLLQLTTDLSRLMKINMIRFDNDAKACYDRIIVALGMLAARRCGMPDHAIRTHAEALEFMQYSVKTIYGISDDTYQGTPFEPLFGTGQGSGASPSVWLSLVVVLLNTLDRLIPERFSFTSPDGNWSNTRLVDAFVDDTSLGFSDSDSDLAHLISRLQSIAQTWEHLLSLSGGALNLQKCSW